MRCRPAVALLAAESLCGPVVLRLSLGRVETRVMSFEIQADRRTFLQASALAGVGYWVTGSLRAAESKSSLEQIQVACVGVGGKGKSDVQNMSRARQDLRPLRRRFARSSKGMAKAYKTEHNFTDYREMLDEMGDRIDAVTDQHARPQPRRDRREGDEDGQARLLPEAAHAHDLGSPPARRDRPREGRRHADGQPVHRLQPDAQGGRARFKAGQLGTVKEVHVWTNRPIWPQGERRPTDQAGAARRSTGNVWLGPAPYRPYGDGYHPFAWRGWWDFGTGALGDMACHTCNMPFMALNMRDPDRRSRPSAPSTTATATRSARRSSSSSPSSAAGAAFTLYWYDGGNMPSTRTVRRRHARRPRTTTARKCRRRTRAAA